MTDIRFRLRNAIGWSLPLHTFSSRSQRPYHFTDQQLEQIKIWQQTYDLSILEKAFPSSLLRLNYYFFHALEMISPFIDCQQPLRFRSMDVGSDSWYYVGAQWSFLRSIYGEHAFELKGIELDPHLMYVNFHTKGDYGRFYSSFFKGAKYLGGNAYDQKEVYDFVFMFLPIIEEQEFIAWGLPKRMFSFRENFISLVNHNVAVGGKLVVMHPSEEELVLFDKNNIDSLKLVKREPCPTLFYEFRQKRWISLYERVS